MSKFHAAADLLKREAQRYRGLMEAAQVLEEVGSLEQAAQEAAARRDRTLDQCRQADARLAQSKGDAEKISADLAEKVVAATEQARGILASAEGRAGEIMAEAEQRAADIINSGQAQASQELARMSEQLATMQSKLTELTDEANAAMARRDQADAAAADAESKLAAVQARIRKLAEA